MARLAIFAAIVLMAAASANARFAPAEGAATGRSLLQSTIDCTRIANCATGGCRNQRVGGSTVLQCTTCASSYKPSDDYSACLCAPGYKRSSGACVACATGNWCAGGADDQGADVAAVACGTGLTTLIPTATREDQCVTVAGYGFTGGAAATCDIGTYSPGNTRNPCRSCGGGLTTVTTGKTSFSDCLAPAGSYFDKNAAKPCPKGTYTTDKSRASLCTPCAPGVTTAEAASTSPDLCTLAKPGYKYVSASKTATKCEKNFYQPAISSTATCTACGTSMVTLKEGAATRAACVAPPGFQYVDDTKADSCGFAHYKSGNNRRPCQYCGDGFNTTAVGKVSFADCYVPQGFGTSKLSGDWVAAKCDAGYYGAAQNTFGVKSLPCTPCPSGMSTPTAGSSGPADCVTIPGWGYDQATGTAQKCEAGSYSVGGNRNECVSCGEGYTTPVESADRGSDAATDCVIAPGYGFTAAGKDPEDCAKGSYGVGGANAPCTSCPPHSTTTVAANAVAITDCNACAPGFITPTSSGCSVTPANTYSAADAPGNTACPSGGQSPAGSESSDACVDDWNVINADTIPLDSSVTAYAADGSATTEAACQAACTADANCMFYQLTRVLPAGTDNKCWLVKQSTASVDAKIEFKNQAGTYTSWAWNSNLAGLGAVVSGGDSSSESACLKACDAKDSCLFVVYKAGTCTLKGSASSPDAIKTAYKAIGEQMAPTNTF